MILEAIDVGICRLGSRVVEIEFAERFALFRTKRRFHKQLHLAVYNRFLVAQLGLVYPFVGLFATASVAVEGGGLVVLDEHQEIVTDIKESDGEAA